MGIVTSGINYLKSKYLNVTNRIRVSHKLDYEKHDLYLCDNIRLASCQKEPDTIKWIETFTKEDVVYDIGANVGAFSLVMAVYSKHVYAFEPSVVNFSLLCKNVIENFRRDTIGNNVTPLNIALAQDTKLEALNYVNLDLGVSGHQIGGRTSDGFGRAFKPTYSQYVLAISLDDLIAQFKLSPPNHIKIDVDGVEIEILKGAGKTLGNPTLRSVLVEVDTSSEEHTLIRNYLNEKGFRLSAQFQIDPSSPNYCNCIYVR